MSTAIAVTENGSVVIALATLVWLILHEITLAVTKINAGYDYCHPWVFPTSCLSILPAIALAGACLKIGKPYLRVIMVCFTLVGIPLLVQAIGTYISLNVGMVGSP